MNRSGESCILDDLAEAYLALVPGLKTPSDCTFLLLTCAKAGYWGPASADGNGGLVMALLQRLSADGCELLTGVSATSRDHSNLWRALLEAPAAVLSSVDLRGLTRASAQSLLSTGKYCVEAAFNLRKACVRLKCSETDPLCDHATSRLAAVGQQSSCLDLANALYALGELAEDVGHKPGSEGLQRLLDAVASRLPSGERPHAFSPEELAAMLLACAKLSAAHPALRSVLHAVTVPLAEACARRRLAAFGPVDSSLSGDLRGLAQEMGSNFSDASFFTPQELSDALLGCAKLGYTDPAFLGPLTAAAGRAAVGMKPQELANSLYSLALLQPSLSAHGGAAEALAEECARRRFANFSAQSLARSTWALGTMGFADQRWYAALVKAAPGTIRGARPHDWCDLWQGLALARHRPAPDKLLELTAEAAGALRARAEPQHCANLLWALATLRQYDAWLTYAMDSSERPGLVTALAGRLGDLVGQDPRRVTPQGLTNSLWALAVMGQDVLSRHSGLVEGLRAEAGRRWEAEGNGVFSKEGLIQLWQVQVELEAIARTQLKSALAPERPLLNAAARFKAVTAAWRLASLPPSALEAEVASALDQLQQALSRGEAVPVEARTRMRQTERELETWLAYLEYAAASSAGEGLCDEGLLLSAARAAALEGASQAASWPPSALEGEVMTALERALAPTAAVLQRRCVVEEAGRCVDAVVELPGGRRVAVQTLGPSGCCASEPRNELTGAANLRLRQLGRVPELAHVRLVPYWEWAQAKAGGEVGQRAYLCGLLGLNGA